MPCHALVQHESIVLAKIIGYLLVKQIVVGMADDLRFVSADKTGEFGIATKINAIHVFKKDNVWY
jgi:hypothetical protein